MKIKTFYRNIIINIVYQEPCKLLYILKKYIGKYSPQTNAMSKLQSLLKPHSIVQGMTVLDRTQFDKVVSVPCINVRENKLTDILPHIKKYLLKIPKLKPIQTFDDQTLIVLNPDLISTWNDIEVNVKEHLSKFHINEENFIFRKQTLTYDNYVADDILKAILPPDQDGMSSYTKIGHIVHVNLREHLLPYKTLIGQVLFDKVPNCETVVNKVNIIDNTYRNFQMEVLCGKEDLKTKIKENGCQFEFDFGTVYWNSRLSTEHERIVKLINKNDVLFDVFAGVGPFSIPIAKKKGVVYANDLNPESFHWLKHNATLNKIDDHHLHVFNKDGKDFILDDIKINLRKHLDQNIHIVMNLPALATDFLKYFIGLYDDTELETALIKNPPTVYVYCFAKGEDYLKITEDLISSSLNRDMRDRIDMFKVRTVSSFKEMMRVKFKLNEDILIKKSNCKRRLEDCNDASCKKQCHGEEQTSEGKEHIQSSRS